MMDLVARVVEESSGAYVSVRQFPVRFELEVLKRANSTVFGEFCGTLQRLALRAFEKSFLKKRLLSDQEIIAITARAIEGIKGRVPDTVYTKIVLKRIRDLVQHGVSAEEVEEASVFFDPAVRKKLEETARILRLYGKFVELSGGYDIPVLFSRAKKFVDNLDVKKVVLALPVFLFPVEIEFLKRLSVTVFGFEVPSKFFFGALQKSNRELFPSSWRIENLAVNPLSFALSLSGREQIKTSTKLYIKGFHSLSENIKYIVDTVLDLLNRGFEPYSIAVVSPDVDRLLPMLYPLLKEKGIPFNFQTRGIPLLASPLVNRALDNICGVTASMSVVDWIDWIIGRARGDISGERAVIEQLEKLRTELCGLRQKGLLAERNLSGNEAQRELRELFADRFYLIEENDPYGVHICSPEAAISLLPRAIIFENLTEGDYPRAFPFDPDFSYAERERINEVLGRSSFSLQAFPTRDRLIYYDFLVFYTLLSVHIEELHVTYDALRGKSLFAKLLSERVKVEPNRSELVSPVAVSCYRVFKGEKSSESREERGVKSWRLRAVDARYNFFISKKLAKQLCSKLTVTDVVNYLECPTSALLSLAFPESSEFTVEQLEGVVYHELIRRLLNSGFDEGKFDEAFERAAGRVNNPVVRLLKPYIRANIKRFLEFFRNDDLFSESAEKEKKVQLRISDIDIEGRIDYVVRKGKDVHIVDFKSGSVSSNSRYGLLKPASVQLVLYGAGYFEEDLYRALESAFGRLNFYFVSVSKARRGVEESKWKVSFSGKRDMSEIKVTASLAATAVIAMKNGYFIPHRMYIKYRPNTPPEKREICLKEDSCFEDYQLSADLLRKFEAGIKKIYNHVRAQWKR